MSLRNPDAYGSSHGPELPPRARERFSLLCEELLVAARGRGFAEDSGQGVALSVLDELWDPVLRSDPDMELRGIELLVAEAADWCESDRAPLPPMLARELIQVRIAIDLKREARGASPPGAIRVCLDSSIVDSEGRTSTPAERVAAVGPGVPELVFYRELLRPGLAELSREREAERVAYASDRQVVLNAVGEAGELRPLERRLLALYLEGADASRVVTALEVSVDYQRQIKRRALKRLPERAVAAFRRLMEASD